MEKIKSRRTKSLTIQKRADEQRRLREMEDEMKKSQRRKEVINRREKVKRFGRRKTKEKLSKGIPQHLKTGDCVLIKQGIGIVRYIGPIQGHKRKEQLFAGIELKETKAKGLNDGSAFGRRYFQCEERRGVFTLYIPKVLQPENILFQLGKLNADLKQKKIEQVKLQNENAALRLENEELQRKFEAEKEKAKLVEIEIFNQFDSDNPPTLPRRLSNKSLTLSEDDEKLPTITDGKKFDQPCSVLNNERASKRIKKTTSPKKKKKQLFRVSSENSWTENDVLDLEKELQKELVKGKMEHAVQALELPDFNAPDDDFVKWLHHKFQQCLKFDTGFQIPDIADAKVKRALLVVTRMLASFTQHVHRKEPYIRMASGSLMRTLDTIQDEESFSSSSSSSEDDF